MLTPSKKLEDIILRMDIPYEFGPDYEEGECYQVDDILNSEDLHEGYFDYGVSKAVFVPEDEDLVVKIPFNGAYYIQYDEETDEPYDEETFCEYENADDFNYKDCPAWDYCRNELNKYELAKENGFEEFFAEIAFYGYIENHPVYLQEKVKMGVYHKKEDISEEAKTKADILTKETTKVINRDWVAAAIEWYGDEKAGNFLRFIHDKGFSDFHTGNIGFRKNGAPVLVDYCGWRD